MNAVTYRKILVPLDGSGWAERAIPHAMHIARSQGARLILLHVYRPPMYEYIDQIALAGVTEIADQIRERAESYLLGLRNELRQQGLNADYVILEGLSPAAAIADFVKTEGVDLVVMSTHGRTGLARFLFGSVAQKIVQSVSVPVMLVRPDEPEGTEVQNPEVGGSPS